MDKESEFYVLIYRRLGIVKKFCELGGSVNAYQT